MSAVVRPFLGLLLALTLMLGTAHLPISGGMSVALCIDGQEQIVLLDANGRPVPEHRPCPDCLPGPALALLPGLSTTPQPDHGDARRVPAPLVPQLAARSLPPPQARGPPLTV